MWWYPNFVHQYDYHTRHIVFCQYVFFLLPWLLLLLYACSQNFIPIAYCVMTQIANLCKLCTKKVQSFSHYLQCTNCLRKCHVRCMDMKVSDITYPDQWYCPPCIENILVYNHYDDNDSFHRAVIEGMLDCSFHHHEMNNKVFVTFEINEGSDTPFSEIDPDFQFYTDNYYIKNTLCDY